MSVEYELISGERRLRASKLAGLSQVPVLIRNGEEDAQLKLEMAIIENLQREDLNAVDRARSFERLAKEFGLKQSQIADNDIEAVLGQYCDSFLHGPGFTDDIAVAFKQAAQCSADDRFILYNQNFVMCSHSITRFAVCLRTV
jgi:ParB-like chromosome segregation protein Spo0J